MKKILSIILALVMLLTASVATVSAATAIDGGEGTSSTGNGGGDYTLGVVGELNDDPNKASTISFDITWDNAEFTYHEAYKGTWDAENHKYTGAEQARWDGEMNITVANHSNTGITAGFSFVAGSVSGLVPVFTTADGAKTSILLKSADADEFRQTTSEGTISAPTGSIKFTLGASSSGIKGDVTSLGSVVISVKQAKAVGTEQALKAALAEKRLTGGTVYLTNDITLTDTLGYGEDWGGTAEAPLVLDLAGHTLTGNISVEGANSNAVIQNGNIAYSLPTNPTSAMDCVIFWAKEGRLTLNSINCNFVIDIAQKLLSLYVASGADVTIEDTELSGFLGMGDCSQQLGLLGMRDTGELISAYVAGELTIKSSSSSHTSFMTGHIMVPDSSKTVTLAKGAKFTFNAYMGTSTIGPLEQDTELNSTDHPDYITLNN